VVKVLVTGGAGYIGSHTAKALAVAGHEPVVFDDLRTGYAENVRWGPLVNARLDDPAAIRDALTTHAIDAVVHFAGSAYVGESMRRPEAYFRNNVGNTLNLLEAMLAAGVGTIVFSSSCATYGVSGVAPITEATSQHPVNPYGESKLMVERMLRWMGEIHGIRWMALRYFNAAGADPDGELGEAHDPETHLVPLAIAAALGGPRLRVFGDDYPTPDGTPIRDYVHVSDLAGAHVAALRELESGRATSGGLNLGTGRGHSVREVIAAVGRAAGRPVAHQVGPRRPGDPPVLVADASSARAVLGWEPRLADLDAIVGTAVAWASRRRPAAQHD
jgi:UDP-arabinose 4-epimerase